MSRARVGTTSPKPPNASAKNGIASSARMRMPSAPPHTEHVLDVLEPTRATDLDALRVVDADLGADVARVRDLPHVDRAARRQHVDQLVLAEIALVVEGHEQPARVDGAQQRAHGRADLAFGVVRTLPRAAVGALARDAVHLGAVPRDQRLPD